MIENYTPNSVVSGTSYVDTIENHAGGAKIYAGAGNDYIFSSTTADHTINNDWGHVTIDGGDGNDTVKSLNWRVSISGGAGADSIYTGAFNYVTLNGGTGNDTIAAGGSYKVIQYAAGDGNDVITGINATDTINITGGAASTVASGSDVIVNVGSGSMTLKNAVGKSFKIVSPVYGVNVSNYGRNSVVSGTSYADTINNYADGAKINAGGGNDYIYSSTTSVTIDGGAGNDNIRSLNSRVSISGGDGADYIYTGTFGYVTLNGGTGNDTIIGSGSNKVIQYASGDGNDIITGITAYDTINISGGTYSTVTSGNDVIVNVGSGSMTLKNAVGKSYKINGTPTPTTPTTPTVPSGSTTTVNLTFTLGSTSFTYSIDDDTMTLKDANGQVTLTINGASNFLRAYTNSALPSGDGNWLSAMPLIGGSGNDKFYGTDAADTFIYSGGNDRIYDYGAGDRIVLGASIDGVKVSGKNVKLQTSEGNLTIKKAVGQKLTLVDADGEETKYVFTKQNRDLDSARIATADQLPSYWFDEDIATDPLDGLIDNKDFALGVDDEVSPKEFFKATTEMLTHSTSKR